MVHSYWVLGTLLDTLHFFSRLILRITCWLDITSFIIIAVFLYSWWNYRLKRDNMFVQVYIAYKWQNLNINSYFWLQSLSMFLSTTVLPRIRRHFVPYCAGLWGEKKIKKWNTKSQIFFLSNYALNKWFSNVAFNRGTMFSE